MSNLLLALLIFGCQGPINGSENPGDTNPSDADTDADADADETEVTFTSTVTYAQRVDEEIVVSVVETDGIGFNVLDGDDTDDDVLWNAQTVYTDMIVLYEFWARVDHYDSYGVHWISDPVNVDSESVELKPCVDLTGTWNCYNPERPEGADDEEFEMSSCTANTTMDEDVKTDGYHFTSEDNDGFMSQDGKMLDLNAYGDTGNLLGQMICDKQ